MVDMSPGAYLAALQRELDGYVARGLEDRANDVRAEIAGLTGKPIETAGLPIETAVKKAPETAGGPRPKGS